MNRQVSKNQLKGAGIGGTMKLAGAKRKAEVSPNKKDESKKRSGLGDITNVKKPGMTLRSSLTKGDDLEKDSKNKKQIKTSIPKPYPPLKSKVPQPEAATASPSNLDKNVDVFVEAQLDTAQVSTYADFSTIQLADLKEKQEESLYSTAIQTPDSASSEDAVAALNEKNTELNGLATQGETLFDFDAECGNDPNQVGDYAADIFKYYKQRELKFPVTKYLGKQKEINKHMRMILVDWMVEVQENFELNHETLYLGIKMVDLFLGKVGVAREKLQLVGATAAYIASKFDERTPPLIDDFCYICDDAYKSHEILKMEAKLLKTLGFDIGMPLSYRFLRRYARCIKLDMEPLTFARYILETALLEYDLIDVRDSMMAAACLLLAMTLKGTKNAWTPVLVHYTGYSFSDLFDLTYRIHAALGNVPAQFKTIKTKYSHKVFFEVALIPIPDTLEL